MCIPGATASLEVVLLLESFLRLHSGGLASIMVLIHPLLSGWKLVYPFLDCTSVTLFSNEGDSLEICTEGQQAALHTYSRFLLSKK